MRTFETRNARAALFLGAGKPLELIEAPIPSPVAGEMVVAVECCALCSSDLHTHGGRRIEPAPTVLGHEIVGRILSTGVDARGEDLRGERIAIGDRITWTVAASCGQCDNCRDGLEQKCVRLVKYGHEKVTREMPFRGGLADVVLLSPGTGIVKLPAPLPPNITVEMMALANCSTATVAAVLRAGFSRRNRPGMSVVVLGAGVLGLTACAMARQIYQASAIIACDADAGRAERAKLFGATHACVDLAKLSDMVQQATGTAGVDVAVELAGSIHTARAAVSIARTGGSVIIAGTTMPTEPLMIEPQSIVRRLLRIGGVHNYVGADLVAAVDFLLKFGAAYPFASLIAEHFELGEIEAAFASGHACAGMRVAVVPGLQPISAVNLSADSL